MLLSSLKTNFGIFTEDGVLTLLRFKKDYAQRGEVFKIISVLVQ